MQTLFHSKKKVAWDNVVSFLGAKQGGRPCAHYLLCTQFQCFGKVEADAGLQDTMICTVPGEIQAAAPWSLQCHKCTTTQDSRSPRHTHPFLLLMHLGVLPVGLKTSRREFCTVSSSTQDLRTVATMWLSDIHAPQWALDEGK